MIGKRGGVYHYDFTIEGRRHRGSCATADRQEAMAMATRMRAEAYAVAKLGAEPRKERITLRAACERYYNEVGRGTGYGEGAQQDHMRAWRGALGDGFDLADMSDSAVSRALAALRHSGLRGERAPGTLNRHLATLSAITKRARENWGADVGRWEMRRHRMKEPSGKETFLDHEQARALIDNLVPHARAPVLLALYTGLRKGNVLGLRTDEISLDLRRLVVRQKGDRRLSVSLVPSAHALLQTVLAERRPADRAFAFTYGATGVDCGCAHCRSPLAAGRPIRDIRTALETAAQKAGLGHLKLRFHDLRHTFASWILAETGSLPLASKALGHSSIKTTARYAHVARGGHEAALAAVADRFDDVKPKREVA